MADTGCGCVTAGHRCGARATAEDLLCDTCRPRTCNVAFGFQDPTRPTRHATITDIRIGLVNASC